MTYTFIRDEGVVVDADGVQVAPCQSVEDPAFVAYQEWIAAGGEPIVIQSREAAQG